MQIKLNGEDKDIAEGSSITDLLTNLQLPGTRVAVEVNKELVRRAEHAEHRLQAGDAVEVVTFVGGG